MSYVSYIYKRSAPEWITNRALDTHVSFCTVNIYIHTHVHIHTHTYHISHTQTHMLYMSYIYKRSAPERITNSAQDNPISIHTVDMNTYRHWHIHIQTLTHIQTLAHIQTLTHMNTYRHWHTNRKYAYYTLIKYLRCQHFSYISQALDILLPYCTVNRERERHTHTRTHIHIHIINVIYIIYIRC